MYQENEEEVKCIRSREFDLRGSVER